MKYVLALNCHAILTTVDESKSLKFPKGRVDYTCLFGGEKET